MIAGGGSATPGRRSGGGGWRWAGARRCWSGYSWREGTLTWGDPGRGLDYGFSYRSDFDGDGLDAPSDGFSALSGRQLASARLALDTAGAGPAGRAGFAVEGFTGLGLRHVADGGSADLRIGNSRDSGTAYAFFPGSAAESGDVWLGRSGEAPQVGNYDHMTVLHEIGHALGLDHAHEGGRNGAVPRALDSPEFTVMTYRAWQGAAPDGYRFEHWGAPQGWMMLDIAALQELYGADFAVNAGTPSTAGSRGRGAPGSTARSGSTPAAR